MKIQKTTVLVTGASSGLGFAFACAFARKNYNIIVVAQDTVRLKKASTKIARLTDGFVEQFVYDLSKPSSGEKLFSLLKEKDIHIDILINNAGFATVGLSLTTDVKEEIGEMTLNMITPTVLSKLCGVEMVKKGNGKILNVASLAAFAPGPYMSVYYATKSYLFRFSTALAYELRGTGVTVSTLCPGPVATDFAKRANATKTRLFSRNLPSADDVVKVAIEGLESKKVIVFYTHKDRLATFILRLLPLRVVMAITKKLNQ